MELFLNQKSREKKMDEMRKLYERYAGGPYEFYHTATLDEVVEAVSQYPANEHFERLDMIARLYYAEAPLHSLPIRTMLLEKAYAIFNYCDRHSGVFSMERRNTIENIQHIINNMDK